MQEQLRQGISSNTLLAVAEQGRERGESTDVAAALSAQPEVVVPGHVEDGLEPRPEHPHAALEVVPGLDHVPRHDERVDAGPVPSATSARAGGRLGLSTVATSTRRSLLHEHPDVRGRCPSTEVEGLVCAAIVVCEEAARGALWHGLVPRAGSVQDPSGRCPASASER